MKKIIIVLSTVLGFISPVFAAGSPSFKFSPSLAVIDKLDESIIDVRNSNFGFEGNLDYFLASKPFGFGASLFFVPLQAKALGTTYDASLSGITIGPRYRLDLDDDLSLIAGVGLGNYNSKSLFNHDNSIGFNVKGEVEYRIDNALFGLQATLHYVSDTGNNDDAVVYSVGPTVGFKF